MTSESRIRPVHTEQDYIKAVARIEALMDKKRSEAENDEYSALVDAVAAYDDQHFPLVPPDPVEAIKFRMEQGGKTRSDMIKIFGSRAKTSEVLNGKRELTLKMIRALQEHLGIHADFLTRDGKDLPEIPPGIDFDRFPVTEMAKRGWIRKTRDLKDRAEEIMRELADCAGGWDALPETLFRQGRGGHANEKTDLHALRAWCLHILCQARRAKLEDVYRVGTINPTFLRSLARFSLRDNGPELARKKLAKCGIAMVVAKHLPETYLDGAALWTIDNVPVVGMTIRHDRIDNFWFCLMHELAHLGRHFPNRNGEVFIDDLQSHDRYNRHDDIREREADEWAQEALIPPDLWFDHPVRVAPKPENVLSLAQKAGVHPAIVAGRIRHERDNFRMLSKFVGSGEVRANLAGEPV